MAACFLSQAAYPSGQRTPAEGIHVLGALKTAFANSHQFWPDDISLTGNSLFDGSLTAGARHVTDVYLLGLAKRHEGTLVSFDRSLSYHAVRAGSRQLVQRPG